MLCQVPSKWLFGNRWCIKQAHSIISQHLENMFMFITPEKVGWTQACSMHCSFCLSELYSLRVHLQRQAMTNIV